ncbi:Gfo/Idh/MocA family protein [Cohnella silvisoli]|uniref:Gfo/Idh/MocA family oxidoreductase n=1 Tax=Cohnella silvisoli TaxID=2873699 RepID=A0ABV1L4B1_9BACL|nr:Gfo/Idh/MocA family oxidoreductase [Cohnella silvisoli]MCD9025850.1 Gfo/Idh/MocA family oxidoreductase [Cohnella silvisoli]
MLNQSKPITVIIVGAGNRSFVYASYANLHPEQLQIVGVVDPDPVRRQMTIDQFGMDPVRQWDNVEQLVSQPPIADAIINGTMDHLHIETTIPLLECGYDVLLEKPVGTTEQELILLQEKAQECSRLVMVCHVLRYAPFYTEVRKRIAAGDIGEIISIQTAEHVCYDHMAVSFVRGKWNSKESCGSSMLMAKCCHDLDIITWLNEGEMPAKISSFGSRSYFRPEKAPEGAGTRCVVDCSIEESCPYSAKKNYVERDRWAHLIWRYEQWGEITSETQKLEILKTSPHGRCVWHCDNDVVDRQSVMVEFSNGSTATHNMIGGSSRPCRTLFVVGTKGEIQGTLEDGWFVIRRPDPNTFDIYTEERVEVSVTNDSHGGGDLRLVEDFVHIMSGQQPSISFTSLDKSITGHRIGFAAEKSRMENRMIDYKSEAK